MLRSTVTAIVLISTGAAFAQNQTPAPVRTPAPPGFVVHLQGECAQDRKRFCADVKPGNGGMIDCLDSHKADLSPACRDHLQGVFALHELAKRQRAYLATHQPKNVQPPQAGRPPAPRSTSPPN